MNERLIYMTAPTEGDAADLARTLIEESLISCANIVPEVRSLYRWKGKIHNESEVIIIAKTMDRLTDALIDRVKELHSYECPCVVSLEIQKGNPAFLSWIDEECK